MPSATITLDATTETYWDIKNLIFDTVWKFQQRYGGDFDEMVAEANLIYIQAFLSHNPNKSQFSTWLRFILWKGLIDFKRFIREENKHIKIEHFEEIENFYSYPAPLYIPFWDLVSGLSDDAKTIVQLILEPPEIMQSAALKKGTAPCNVKRALRIHLSYILGWSANQIKESFAEITAVIND